MADSASVANRDSAMECIAKARASAKQGALADAIRLVDKSLRLYPTDDARTLRQALQMRAERRQAAAAGAAASASPPPSSPPAPRSKSSGAGAAQRHGPVKGAYAHSDEVEAVTVVNTKCYYSRLGLAKGATKAEIKRAFKRRAMQFHPDKNHAPAAADAFKAVNEAHQCLSNDDSRRHYDMYGVEEGAAAAAAARAQHAGAFAYQDAQELTPEDILHMFFNGGPRMRTRRTRRAHGMHEDGAAGTAGAGAHTPYAYLLQFLPLLLLLLFSMLGGPASDDSPFRLEKEGGFPVARTTAANDVPYFVSRGFARWYARDYRALARIEAMVEQQHAANLQRHCRQQRTQRARAIRDAKKVRGAQQAHALHAAYRMQTPACASLDALYAAAA